MRMKTLEGGLFGGRGDRPRVRDENSHGLGSVRRKSLNVSLSKREPTQWDGTSVGPRGDTGPLLPSPDATLPFVGSRTPDSRPPSRTEGRKRHHPSLGSDRQAAPIRGGERIN